MRKWPEPGFAKKVWDRLLTRAARKNAVCRYRATTKGSGMRDTNLAQVNFPATIAGTTSAGRSLGPSYFTFITNTV